MNKERIKLIVTQDIMFRAPLWALLILMIWGAICFLMFWVLLNVIKPSIDKKIKTKDQQLSLVDQKYNRLLNIKKG